MNFTPVPNPPLSESAPSEIFGIGEVSRLTGISDHTIRVWERRYRVVDPSRTQSRRREYDRGDIRRLSLLKALVDLGHSIRNVAPLSTEALEVRLREALPTAGSALPPAGPFSPTRIAFSGSLTRDILRAAADAGPGLQITGEFSSIRELGTSLRPGAVDLLVVECPAVFEEEVATIQQLIADLGARRAVVIYRFAKSGIIEPSDKDIRRITALRAPVDVRELRLACLADVPAGDSVLGTPARSGPVSTLLAPSPAGELPPRLFSDAQLARIARHSSIVQCECPQHLANLLAGLSAFEVYSAECENRNEVDARLHAYLRRATAECRSGMETALRHLMEVEGIPLAE